MFIWGTAVPHSCRALPALMEGVSSVKKPPWQEKGEEHVDGERGLK